MNKNIRLKEKLYLLLWILSGIYLLICGIELFGLTIPHILKSVYLLILSFSIIIIFIVDTVVFALKRHKSAIEDLKLLPDEDYSEPIKEHMYIRSGRYKHREERYVTDLEGHVYYRIKARRYWCRVRKYDVYRGYNDKVAKIIRYRRGKSELYRYVLKINGKEYHAEIFSREDDTLTEESPYIFDFNETNDFNVIDKKTKEVIACTRGVYTESGYSSTDQDVMIYKKDIDPSMILLLTSLTFMKNIGSYHK